jgi:hypothetical protein
VRTRARKAASWHGEERGPRGGARQAGALGDGQIAGGRRSARTGAGNRKPGAFQEIQRNDGRELLEAESSGEHLDAIIPWPLEGRKG